jgi:bifunctional DNA-binding transcriptional regulator/antitoxin component of YhaV-PrlF toxin-antitoxin module
MPTLTQRTLIKFGENGLVLTIPKAWIDYYQLKPGDKLEVIANGELTIRPLKKSETIQIKLLR